MSFIFTDNNFVYQTKEKINAQKGVWRRIARELKYKADEALKEETMSVTFAKSPAASGNIHDYFSEGLYWWPDPKCPQGPYIRRDGQINPDRFTNHRDMMEKMSKTVLILAQAGYFLDNPEYTERAAKHIRTWFLNEDTMMNPHLEYGQAIRGVCEGRGIGIIETKDLLGVIHAANFMEETCGYDDEIRNLKKWFGSYLKWLNESPKGIEEREWYNNHAIWWTAQALAFAAFTDNKKLMLECYDRYKNNIIGKQLNSDSAFEDELGRTRSYTYYLFSLDASSIICEIALTHGVDLWSFQTSEGKSLEGAFEFIYPYFENLFLWKYKQISLHNCFNESLAFQLASVRLAKPHYEKMNGVRREGKYLIGNTGELGSPALLPGFTSFCDNH